MTVNCLVMTSIMSDFVRSVAFSYCVDNMCEYTFDQLVGVLFSLSNLIPSIPHHSYFHRIKRSGLSSKKPHYLFPLPMMLSMFPWAFFFLEDIMFVDLPVLTLFSSYFEQCNFFVLSYNFHLWSNNYNGKKKQKWIHTCVHLVYDCVLHHCTLLHIGTQQIRERWLVTHVHCTEFSGTAFRMFTKLQLLRLFKDWQVCVAQQEYENTKL